MGQFTFVNWLEVDGYVWQHLSHRRLSLSKKWQNKSLCWGQRSPVPMSPCRCSKVASSAAAVQKCVVSLKPEVFSTQSQIFTSLSWYAQSPCLELNQDLLYWKMGLCLNFRREGNPCKAITEGMSHFLTTNTSDGYASFTTPDEILLVLRQCDDNRTDTLEATRCHCSLEKCWEELQCGIKIVGMDNLNQGSILDIMTLRIWIQNSVK